MDRARFPWLDQGMLQNTHLDARRLQRELQGALTCVGFGAGPGSCRVGPGLRRETRNTLVSHPL